MRLLKGLFIVALCFLFASMGPIDGLKKCEEAFLKSNAISQENKYEPLCVADSNNCPYIRQYLRSSYVMNGLSYARLGSASLYKLVYRDKTLYLLSFSNRNAVGLAINFMDWMIIDDKGKVVSHFKSLSENPKLIFFNEELQITTIDFNAQFYEYRNYDHVYYDIVQHVIDKKGILREKGRMKTDCLE